MNIIKNYNQYIDEIHKLSRGSSFLYVSTYGFRKTKQHFWLLNECKKIGDTRVIIGKNYGLDILETKKIFLNYNFKCKFREEHHLKLIVSDKGAIVGGFNITGSGFKDLAILFKRKQAITELKKHFLKCYNEQ